MNSLQRLKKACDKYGQRQTAKKIGYSVTAVNQVLKGNYPKPEPVLLSSDRVFGEMCSEQVHCPVLGEIHPDVCRRYAHWASSGKVHSDRMYRQVRKMCNECKEKAC